MAKDYEREIKRLYRDMEIGTMDASISSQARILFNKLDDKWSKIFNSKSKSITDKFISRVDRDATASLSYSLKELSGGLTIDFPDMPEALNDKVVAATVENVALIRSIGSQFHSRIQSNVMSSLQTGKGALSVFEYIKKAFGMADRRAKIIADDQTRKLTTAINSERMKSVGVKQFEWMHSHGGAEPRELHVSYNGQIFDIDDPPIIDKRTGQRGLPGDAINCRCRMRPVLTF